MIYDRRLKSKVLRVTGFSCNANLGPRFLSEVARWNEISADWLLCGTSNADFPLTSRAEASPCPKAYLFLTGRCSLASLVKPQTVDQICSQAHCADEGLFDVVGLRTVLIKPAL